jgi:hypothetical protein
MPLSFPRRATAVLLFIGAAAAPLAAQQSRSVTADDYTHAERFLAPWTMPLVYGAGVRATWLPNDRFWYRTTTPAGAEFILVDPARGTRARAFDQARIAAGLSAATGQRYEAMQLPFTQFEYTPTGEIRVRIGARRFDCNPETGRCGAAMDVREEMRAPAVRNGAPPVAISPDGKRAAFIRDYNLWVRDVATGAEKQLTQDGVKRFGYATDNAGWTHSDRPILVWSPDSKKIATFQQDERGVGEMYLVNTVAGHPTLQAWRLDRRPVVSRWLARRVRLHVARSQEGERPRRRREYGRRARPVRGERAHPVRVRQWQGELGRAAGDERGDLVLRAQRLGPALPV